MEATLTRLVTRYGYIPMLMVLGVMEEKEEYEICLKISRCLNQFSKGHGIEIPNRYSYDAMIRLKVDFMVSYGLSGETAEKNMPQYCDEIIKAITTQIVVYTK